MTTTKLHITKVEDHEGMGRCGHCEREGLRWIVVLSDGTSVGTECAKRVLGYTLKPASYTWMTGYAPIAEYSNKWETAVVYANAAGRTNLVVNGHLQVIGAGMREFTRLYAS